METGENKPNIFIKSKNFNTAHSEQHILSIVVSFYEFTFTIIDEKTKKYMFFKSFQFNSNDRKKNIKQIKNIIESEEVLKLHYVKSYTIFKEFQSTLVPQELYDNKNKNEYYKFNFGVENDIMADQVVSQKLIVLYSVASDLKNLIQSLLPNSIFLSQESILIEKYAKKNTFTAHAYFSKKYLNFTVFDKDKLIFNNQFIYFNEEDVLFFVLFCFEQLKISNTEIILKLYGDISTGDRKHKILFDYIKNVEFGKRNIKTDLPVEFNQISDHNFFELFSLDI